MIEISKIFNVTTDYLLKESDVDELTIRTEMLEKSHQALLEEAKKKDIKRYRILSCTLISLITFAITVIFRFALFRFHEHIGLPDLTGYTVILAVAIAIVIAVNMRYVRKENSNI